MALEYTAPPAPAPTPPLVISGTPYYIAMFNAAGDNVVDSNVYTTAAKEFVFMRAPNGTLAHVFTTQNTQNDNSYSIFWTSANSAIAYLDNEYFFRIAETTNNNNIFVGVNKLTFVPFVRLVDNVNTSVATIELDDSLQITTTDNKSVIFSQASQDAYMIVENDSVSSSVTVKNGVNDANAQIVVNATTGYFRSFSVDETSKADLRAENGNTLLELIDSNATIFRADATGISTDGTNFWQLGAASAGAPTADSKIRVTINGVDYDIAAEAA